MKLKDFQQQCLNVLAAFAADAAARGPEAAFNNQDRGWKPEDGWYRRPLDQGRHVLGGDPPYVCIRVPTGGGKTMLGARAIGTVFQHGLQRDHGVVLWLVPSTEIAEQTLRALRNPRHPYRRALADGLGSEDLQVYDLEGAKSLSRAEVVGETVIIVATLQSFRQSSTDGRKVYEDSGALFAFRDDLRAAAARFPGALELIDGTREPRCSLRNVIAMRAPLVLLDEAHIARTSLSFETLARLRPAWILELTATPDRKNDASNVLHKVFASELKHAGLIKLPIELESATSAEDAMQKAKSRRDSLEAQANALQGRYLRPICLVQAEPAAEGNEWTVKRVIEYLTTELDIPADQVVEHTGVEKGTRGRDLFSPKETIRYIVTQKALAEGWDCSFAYVLCGLAASHSVKDVEQLLGRIMRMPQAQGFDLADLNRAYGVIRTTSFMKTVSDLRERFVERSGFEGVPPAEIIAAQPDLPNLDGPGSSTMDQGIDLPALDLSTLPDDARAAVIQTADGRLKITRANLARYFAALRKASPDPKALHAVAQLNLSLSQQGVEVRVPELFYKGQLFREGSFAIRPLPIDTLDPADLQFVVSGVRQVAELDAVDARLDLHFADGVREPDLPYFADGATSRLGLASSLDRLAHRGGKHMDVPSALGRRYCERVIQYLLDTGSALPEIERARFRLGERISLAWDKLRENTRTAAWQAALNLSGDFQAQPGRNFAFRSEDQYLPKAEQAHVKFKRHLYRTVGKLNDEELPVAQVLDSLPAVKAWVRNLDPAIGGNPQVSFWLQLANSRFYPDLVAVLQDGRTAVIEYKGEHLDDSSASDEKRAIGQVWAKATGGIFEWVTQGQVSNLPHRWTKLFEAKR